VKLVIVLLNAQIGQMAVVSNSEIDAFSEVFRYRIIAVSVTRNLEPIEAWRRPNREIYV
jgi:hypothetical protein